MNTTVDLSRNVPRLGLNRAEVAAAIGVSANTVDLNGGGRFSSEAAEVAHPQGVAGFGCRRCDGFMA